MTSINKPFKDMTLEELNQELDYWNNKIDNATRWGASLGVAIEIRDECAEYIRLKLK